ncbi:phosphotransferase family protein [Fodinicola feengrottensis]|uniref:phosphotransferase family protein n=1 Tax=Fodinicola feengrottensis TaxID=435914 RepID=UPI002440F3C5|nr:phosphotransferase family protein [Fodinicola feengrottensis]
MSGGRSNLTYRVTDAVGVVRALRRPPTGGVLSTAHDMRREWRFVTALASTEVPVPEPLAYCADPAVTGAEFYVMGFVDGLVLADEEAAAALALTARQQASFGLIEVMARLHAVDPVTVGLGDLVREEGYVERQLRRWRRQLHQSGSPDLVLLDRVHDALSTHVPAQRTGIVHGDFRPGNLSFGSDGRVLAVFDWELATVGEPLADLGWLSASWGQPGDDVPPTIEGPSTAPGFPSREQLAEHYAKLSGRDVSELPFYEAFARWRGACIGAGVRARYLAGVMGADGFDADVRTEQEHTQATIALELS